MTNALFGEFDNFPASTEDTPRVVFVYVENLNIFNPKIVDHRTGKIVPYTMLRFDNYYAENTTVTGQVNFRDKDTGNFDSFHAVFDFKMEG